METIRGKLIRNGLMFRKARLRGDSIHSGGGIEARIILKVRAEAWAAGYTRRAINRLEMMGERGEYGLRSKPYEAIFRGYEVLPNGWRLRSYDVAGDHRLAGSTVGVVDLIRGGIMPHDIGAVRLAFEYVKETAIIVWGEIQLKFLEVQSWRKSK